VRTGSTDPYSRESELAYCETRKTELMRELRSAARADDTPRHNRTLELLAELEQRRAEAAGRLL
jgi:hypothetical protein